MNAGKTLFAQVIDYLPWKTFYRAMSRYEGDYRIRTLLSTEHFRGTDKLT